MNKPAEFGSLPVRGAPNRLSQEDFDAIARMARQWFGLSLPPAKKTMVEGRLSRRLRKLKLTDFTNYRRFIESSEGLEERTFMLGCLTTNVTQFFREKHHFEYLCAHVLPPAVEASRRGGRVRLWSAGCSTGQEPYTLAMAVLDAFPDAADLNLRILATDIDPFVLQTAAAGAYETEELAGLTEAQRNRFLEPVAELPGVLRFTRKVRGLIHFAELNLMERFPMKGPFDGIFCRNVMIYFDDALRHELLSKFVNLLGPDGHLFIGHSEQVSGPVASRIKRVGPTIFTHKS